MLSPAVYALIAQTIRDYPVNGASYDSLVAAYEEVIMQSVVNFMQEFSHAEAWLAGERVHDTVGYVVGVNERNTEGVEQHVRMVFSPLQGVYVFTPDEMPLDELYEVRKVIVEARRIDPDDDSTGATASL